MDSAFEVISERGGEIEQERGTTCPHSFVVPVVHRNAAARPVKKIGSCVRNRVAERATYALGIHVR